MPEPTVPITVRISPRLKAAVVRQTRRDHLSLTDVVRIFFLAYAKGEIEIDLVTKMKDKVLAS
jgi:hypothetical protein